MSRRTVQQDDGKKVNDAVRTVDDIRSLWCPARTDETNRRSCMRENRDQEPIDLRRLGID